MNTLRLNPGESTRARISCPKVINGSCILAPNKKLNNEKCLLQPYVYSVVSNHETDVWIANLSKNRVMLMANTTVAYAEPCKSNASVYVLDEDLDINKSNKVHRNKELEPILGENLSMNERKGILELINEFSDCFVESELDVGKTNRVTHKIETGNNVPVRSHPYRASFVERGKIKQKVAELKKADVVRDSCSPWSSPVVLVPKKNGEYRLCVDYRKLNAITKKNAYPLPRMEDALERLGGSKYFTVLDLISGFYQIEVDEKDREKTAFVTPDGLYEFNRLPMGLCNAPSTFQYLMDVVLSNLKWTMVLVYLDDLIVFAKTFEEHQRRLRIVLDRLREANLKLKISKCHFGEDKIRYLGHIVSENGLEVDPEKITAVVKFPVPKTQTDVRSFVNMCGYYRKFVKNFGRIAAPLNKLLKKPEKESKGKVKVTWLQVHQDAFDKLKLALVSAPILGFPMEQGAYEIHCDSSGYGIGATLVQIQNGNPVVISFLSRSMTDVEKRYTTSEQECLAVVYSIKKFRPYIYGTEFTVYTDHNSLKWLFSVKDPNGRLARWSFLLQSYSMTICHRAGRISNDVDPLSRYPVGEPESFHSSSVFVTSVEEKAVVAYVKDLKEHQLKDVWCSKIIEYINNQENGDGNSPKPNISHIEDYSIREGILYYANFDPNGRSWKIVVPKGFRKRILEEIHSETGHFGMTKTWILCKSRFHWNNMYKDVRRFVLGCKICQAHRRSVRPENGPMQTFEEIHKPFERIGIDFIGPFTKSSKGNRFAMIFIDHFTRYVESVAVPNSVTETVIDCLKDYILYRHSVPKEIILDQGRQFISELNKQSAEDLGYQLKFTAPYHPQTNGMTERVNQTIKKRIAKKCAPDQKDWDTCLKSATFYYNTAVHESTGFSPFYLLYGHDARLPVDVKFPIISNSENSDESHFERIKANRLKAMLNSNKSHEKNKKRVNLERVDRPFKLKELVFRIKPPKKKGLSPALMPKQEGPYEILRQIGPVNYQIQKLNSRSKPITVNVKDLIHCHSEFTETSNSSNYENENAISNSRIRVTQNTCTSNRENENAGSKSNPSSSLSKNKSSSYKTACSSANSVRFNSKSEHLDLETVSNTSDLSSGEEVHFIPEIESRRASPPQELSSRRTKRTIKKPVRYGFDEYF